MREDVRAFVSPTDDAPLALEMTGISYCDGSYRIERQNAPFYVFEYVAKGAGTLIIDDRTYTPTAGDVFIIPTGSDNVYFADPADPWIKIFFCVRGSLPRHLLKGYGLQGRVIIPSPDSEEQFEVFFELAQNGKYEEIIDRCALLFHEIVRRLYKNGKLQSPGSAEAAKLKLLLDDKICSWITTDELAAKLGRSKDHVNKLFRREFNETPHAYFTRKKLEVAMNLLTETKLSSKEIAAYLGYGDQHYFSNAFKKAYGFSPLKVRKEE